MVLTNKYEPHIPIGAKVEVWFRSSNGKSYEGNIIASDGVLYLFRFTDIIDRPTVEFYINRSNIRKIISLPDTIEAQEYLFQILKG